MVLLVRRDASVLEGVEVDSASFVVVVDNTPSTLIADLDELFDHFACHFMWHEAEAYLVRMCSGVVEHVRVLGLQVGQDRLALLNRHAFQGLLGPFEKRIYSCVNYIVYRILSIL